MTIEELQLVDDVRKALDAGGALRDALVAVYQRALGIIGGTNENQNQDQ